MIITIVKTLDEQVPSGELRAFFDSLTPLGVFSIWNNIDFAFIKLLTLLV